MRQFFFDDPFAVADYVKAHCPQDIQSILQVADEVAERRFLFNLRWDMERTYKPVVFENEIDWLYQPGDDPEWIYAFNRMRFWICLGQAYALTRDEKYAEAFAAQATHWIQTVRRDDPKNAKAWRSIEAGLRLEYWLKAMQYFKDSPAVTEDVRALFEGSVIEHAEFLMSVWDSYHIMSNWGVLENHGLFLAGVMLPPTERTAQYTAEALSRLEKELRMQVYRDGTQWEQSPMYHNEVLHCYLDVVLLAQRNGIELPAHIPQKVRDMCFFDLYAAKPDHNEISMGDSDEIDQRDLISKGAYLFGDNALKARGYETPDFDTAWDIGERGIKDYAALRAEMPASPDRHFADSGNAYLRSGWSEDATFLHFHCGTLGAGHGHADKLHLDLFSRGEDLLVDAGRFSYVFGPERVAFKELCAHNVPVVDGRDFYVCKDAWECFDLTRGINQRFYADSRYGYAEGGHLAYVEPLGVFTNRRVIFLKPDIVVVCDEFFAKGSHTYNQLFHLNNAGTLSGEGGRYVYESAKLRAEMAFMGSGLSSRVLDTRLSRHYNHCEPNKTIETALAGEGFVSAFSVFGLSSPGDNKALTVEKLTVSSNFKGIVFTDAQVEALNVSFGEARYTVAVAHREFATPTDTFLADGCIGFGSAVVFDRAAGEHEIGTVLIY